MSETGAHDPWHEALLATLRERAESNQRQHGTSAVANVPIYNWPEVSSSLSRAATVAVADATIPVDRRHTGVRRTLIIGIRRVIVALLRFLTTRQSEYNFAIVHAVRETGRGVRSLEKRLAAQDEETRQLRQRISHLEKHLPVEINRKAS
jgi:hypothetical protein